MRLFKTYGYQNSSALIILIQEIASVEMPKVNDRLYVTHFVRIDLDEVEIVSLV